MTISSVVTGIGPVSACGYDAEDFWQALLTPRSKIQSISRFDTTSHSCKIGGQVDDNIIDTLIDPKQKRTTPHVTHLALAASEIALKDAGIDAPPPSNTGVILGTALGGWVQGERQYGVLLEKGARRVNPFLVSGSGNHGAGAEVASAIGANGPQHTFSSGCPSALQAIEHGASLVRSGEVDVCIAGGSESPLSPMVVAALSRTNELSRNNEDPESSSRPFDAKHDGMVLSEGACLLTLEGQQRASARGATVYARILGGASSCDAQGLYQFDKSGETGAATIHRLLQRTGVRLDQIDYICAHANSSPAFDLKESIVIKRAFGEFAARIPVSSIKGVLGHPFGASGSFQVAAAALAIKSGEIPPTHNLTEPSSDCDLDLVRGGPRRKRIRHALVTSYGYGGINSYLLLQSPDSD